MVGEWWGKGRFGFFLKGATIQYSPLLALHGAFSYNQLQMS